MGNMANKTKRDMQETIDQQQRLIEELSRALEALREQAAHEKFELLQRLYPYMANELDSLR